MTLKKLLAPAVLVVAFSLFVFFASLSSISSKGPTGYAVAGDTVVPAIECGQRNTIFRTSSERNAHAELYQANTQDYNYDYAACSPFSFAAAPTRICDSTNSVVSLSSSTNAHAEQADEGNYDSAVCYGDLACEYAAGSTCDAGSTCLFSISSSTNAHVAECGVYDIQVCCSSEEAGVDDIFPNDPCSFQEFKDKCGSADCAAGSLNYNNLCKPTCDNDQADTGERCDTCYPDAGCVSGQSCCINPASLQGACYTSCGANAIFPPGCASGKTDANEKCVCNTENDGLCAEHDTACLSQDPDCQTEGSCQIEDGEWEAAEADEGDSVGITIFTNEFCEGSDASFEVFEKEDTGSDTRAAILPAGAEVANAEVATAWTAEYIDDGFLQGDPEYYFVARIASSQFTSGILAVSKGAGAGGVCGNDEEDTGESCATCSEDAGCYEGEVCCGTGGTAVCEESCQAGIPPEDDGCAEGLDYDATDETCVCVEDEDDVCPDVESGCFFEDPDCDDGDNAGSDDVCPMSNDPNQLDMDLDAQDNDGDGLLDNCEFGIAGLGQFGITPGRDAFCGGDVCDYDADNDGVCDRSPPSGFKAADRDSLDLANGRLCFGQDRCIIDPQGQEVNDEPGPQQGCTNQDVTCMVQWDCTKDKQGRDITWSQCINGLQTRDIGDCSTSGIAAGLCECAEYPTSGPACRSNAAYRPSTQEACVSAQEAVEEDFPFFTWANAVITLLLIAGFYMWRKA